MPNLEKRPMGHPSAHYKPTWRHLGQVFEHHVQILPAGRLRIIQQEGQGKDDVMLQKAFSGEEKSNSDTTKTKLRENPGRTKKESVAHPHPHLESETMLAGADRIPLASWERTKARGGPHVLESL